MSTQDSQKDAPELDADEPLNNGSIFRRRQMVSSGC
jgi:hypothetical protein